MSRRGWRERSNAKWVLVTAIGIAALMLTVGIPTSASAQGAPGWAHSKVVTVLPSGGDDTTDLQAAFDACTGHGGTCTIRLVSGTYHTAQIATVGFEGRLTGAGEGRTVIEALPNLPAPAAAYNTETSPFWAGAPGSSNPWPVLFTFVGGTVSVSRMTFSEPWHSPVPAGWYGDPSFAGAAGTSLWAIVMVTGEHADAVFDHVSVNGGEGDLALPSGAPPSFNSECGIAFQGILLPSTWTEGMDPWYYQTPLSGHFTLKHSALADSLSPAWVENLLDSSVEISLNAISGAASGFYDLSDSHLAFFGNQVTNAVSPYGSGFWGMQSAWRDDLLPSTVEVRNNYIETSGGAAGAVYVDGGALWGVPSTLSVVVAGNVIVSDMSCGCYTYDSAQEILAGALVSADISHNLIVGGGAGIAVFNGMGSSNQGPSTIRGNTVVGADVGVMLYYTASGSIVTSNVISDSLTYGVLVGGEAGTNLIAHNFVRSSGAYDLYWDGSGAGNVWLGNHYDTSSPAGLD